MDKEKCRGNASGESGIHAVLPPEEMERAVSLKVAFRPPGRED